MRNTRLQSQQNYNNSFSFIMPALIIWGVMILILLGFIWFTSDFSLSLNKYYLLPWCVLAGIIILTPSLYYIYKDKFDLFHPLIFGVWTYIFPSFVIGGVILEFGLSEPYFLTLIDNPEYNLPLSLMYVVLGYVGIVVGFALPIGEFLRKLIEPWMPKWEWKADDVWVPGIFLLICGLSFNIVGFLQGVIGYQRVDEAGIFDGLVYFLVPLLVEGSLLLWLGIFTVKQKTGLYYIVLTLLIALIPLKMALQGNRGSLFGSVIIIVAAFQYSGRHLKFKHSVIWGLVLGCALFVGMVYGTAFRSIKVSESKSDAGDYVGQVFATFDHLFSKDISLIIYDGATALAERVDNLSALAVTVSNYEKLATYEGNFGLENNIVNDLYTSFIPRFVWADKPPTSDPRAFSDLY